MKFCVIVHKFSCVLRGSRSLLTSVTACWAIPKDVAGGWQAIWGVPCGGRAAPSRLFLKWYRTGDVIFYDLEARRRLGVERPNLALHLQKWYDTFSHSAIFLWCVPPPDPSGAPLLNWA